MKQVQWIPVRLNNLPTAYMQTQKVLERFLIIRQDLLEGDLLELGSIIDLESQVPFSLPRSTKG